MQPRYPVETVLCRLVQEHIATYLTLYYDGTGAGLPSHVKRDFRNKCLECEIPVCQLARSR